MRVLMVSNDKRIVDNRSDSAKRMIELGSLVESLTIIVLRASGTKTTLSDRVVILPAGRNKILGAMRAVFMAKGMANVDLVTAQDPFLAGLAGYLISRLFGLKLQLQLHTDVMNPYFRNESLTNWLRYRLALFLLPRADCVRVVSERLKNSLVKRFGYLKISVLPVFVDVEKIKDSPPAPELRQKYSDYENIVLMMSRLTREKNIPLALAAMKAVVGRHPKTLLLIVGEGPERGNLESRIRNHGLTGNVVIESWTENLAPYYKVADIYLLISNYEGYGRTVIEAMAAGCPVVMTDVGLAGDLVTDGINGLVVPVASRELLESAILRLLDDRNLGNRLAESARSSANCLPSKAAYLEVYRKSWQLCL